MKLFFYDWICINFSMFCSKLSCSMLWSLSWHMVSLGDFFSYQASNPFIFSHKFLRILFFLGATPLQKTMCNSFFSHCQCDREVNIYILPISFLSIFPICHVFELLDTAPNYQCLQVCFHCWFTFMHHHINKSPDELPVTLNWCFLVLGPAASWNSGLISSSPVVSLPSWFRCYVATFLPQYPDLMPSFS